MRILCDSQVPPQTAPGARQEPPPRTVRFGGPTGIPTCHAHRRLRARWPRNHYRLPDPRPGPAGAGNIVGDPTRAGSDAAIPSAIGQCARRRCRPWVTPCLLHRLLARGRPNTGRGTQGGHRGILVEQDGRVCPCRSRKRPASQRCLRGVREQVQPARLHRVRPRGLLRIPARPRQGPLPRERAPCDQIAAPRTGGLHVVLHLPALSLRPNAEWEQVGRGHNVELPYEGVAAAAERATQRMAWGRRGRSDLAASRRS